MITSNTCLRLLALALTASAAMVVGIPGPNFCINDDTCVKFMVGSSLAQEAFGVEILRTGMHGCAAEVRSVTTNLQHGDQIVGYMDYKCSYEVAFKFSNGTKDMAAPFTRNNLRRGMNRMVINEDSNSITISKMGAGTTVLVKTFKRERAEKECNETDSPSSSDNQAISEPFTELDLGTCVATPSIAGNPNQWLV